MISSMQIGKFGTYVRKWNRHPVQEQTWNGFQQFFRAAQEELKETSDLAVSDTQYHQANFIREIIDGIKQEIMQPATSEFYANMAEQETRSIDPSITSLQSEISSFKSTIEQMQTLQQAFLANHTPHHQHPQSIYANSVQQPGSMLTGNSTSSNTPTQQVQAPQANPRRPKQWKYCWTHGVQLSHDSPTCRYKAQGHIDEATMENRCGTINLSYKVNNVLKHKQNSIAVPQIFNKPITSNPVVLKPDSGASAHFICTKDKHILENLKNEQGPNVMLPDMSVIRAKQKGTLPMTEVSAQAKSAHVLPNLKSVSLLSLGQLCDDNCEVKLTKKDIK